MINKAKTEAIKNHIINSISNHSNFISIIISIFSMIFSVFTFYMTVRIEDHSNYLSDLQAPCLYTLQVEGDKSFDTSNETTLVQMPKAKIILGITSGTVLDIGNIILGDEGQILALNSWSVSQHQPQNQATAMEEASEEGVLMLSYRSDTWNYDPLTKSAYTILFVKTGNNETDVWLLVINKEGELEVYGYNALPNDPNTKYPDAFEAYRDARAFLIENDI